MKTKSIITIQYLIIISLIAIFSIGATVHKLEYTQREWRIANTYFRIGVESGMLAQRNRDEEMKELGNKHPGHTYYLEKTKDFLDFQIETNDLSWGGDDSRVFDVTRQLWGGTVVDLDTNKWLCFFQEHTNQYPRIWTFLKQYTYTNGIISLNETNN